MRVARAASIGNALDAEEVRTARGADARVARLTLETRRTTLHGNCLGKCRMPRPITPADLPEDLARFAEAQVAAGRFDSVEDVLRAGKEALVHEQRRQEHKLAKLRAAIAEGDASPDAEPGVFERIRMKYGLRAGR